jgi:hypothetical protein
MLGIRAERGKALLSTKRALEVGAETVWLPKTDTYPNTRLENPAWPQFSTLLTEAEDVESKDCWGGFACK